MSALYTAKATASGGREGKVLSSDGVLDLTLAMPKELGGSGGEFTNPEQLFAAGYSACFHSALKLVARFAKVSSEGSTVTAEVSLHKEGAGYKLSVNLAVHLPGLERAEAQSLVEKAHQVCPYSNATRGNIEVTLNIV
ncbi:organic hydroperoxide resistance protein [Leptospira idonii]|uniref:Organic hydroperoxide resistance protein n=1 Tax=Leptospira idonii TaxID=1193500 RepID=A0A4R9LZH1_9LEPT|nr:organic hydroperoxide resistance protein [Leptospira idonii]TGN18757.1 organic hydroperoxide resistance protein [Leptospira idonii]